ncbi:MAG: RDD family protein [Nocardioidaceae bacterium]|nr:RDD family protein [Nocardioidaceae bacterium]
MAQDRRGLGRLTGAMTEKVVEAIDPDIVLDQVDVNALMDRIDVNRVLDRVDIDRLLDRVDIERLLARVDTAALVQRSGVPEIVAESTGRFAGSALDTGRRQLVVVDVLTARLVDALFRRRRQDWAHCPPRLRPAAPRVTRDGRLDVSGRYAGWLTRMLASVADVWFFITAGTLLLAGADFLARKSLGHGAGIDVSSPWWVAVVVVVGYLYVFLSLEVAGRTPGMALVGLRAVAWDGARLRPKAAATRALVLPLSALTVVGSLGVLLQRDRRALHDRISRTAVVHDWAPRPVLLPPSIAASLLPESGN